jgi:vWA-MoxR associated protein C-terminal domain/vWA-MoxR associated protein middle region (VMAP-M) 1/Trypsin-like peptidase domain
MREDTAVDNSTYTKGIARIYKVNKVIGAGFFVEGGYVLTCAHVIRDALALQEGASAIGQSVTIDFPYLSLSQKLTAEILLYRYISDEDNQNEDIAGLWIKGSIPAGLDPVALSISYRPHNPYLVIGFPAKHPKGIASSGQFLTELPNGWVHLEDTKGQGLAILPGFSGAPVWEEASSTIVGMVVAREKDQPEAKIGFMVPGKKLIAVHRELDSLSLLHILQGTENLLGDSIKTAFRLCCPSGWEIPSALSDKLLVLQDVKRGDRSYEAIDSFVALLNLPPLNPDLVLRDKLQSWLEPRVENYQELLKSVETLLNQQQIEHTDELASHLLIYVKDESGDARSVSALFVRDAREYSVKFGIGSEPVKAPGKEPFLEKVTQETLPNLVKACLSEVLDKSPSNLMLHLILPMSWLHEECDRWSVMDCSKHSFLPDVRIGVRFCCIVRMTERLNPEYLKMFQEPWRNKWMRLLEMPSTQVCAAFVAGDGLSGNELFAMLNQSTRAGLKLSTVYEESQYSPLFGALIATGTPAAIWVRQDQFLDEICVIDQLDQLLNGSISRLPRAVQQFRSDAMLKAEKAHIGHHLSFLWEDPNLIPPSTQMSLGMPQS